MSIKSLSSFQQEKGLRLHTLCSWDVHCQILFLSLSADRDGKLLFLMMSSYTHFQFTFMTIKFSLHLINFTSGSSFSHALNLSCQRHQHNYSFALPYNRQQFLNNNIITINVRQTSVLPLGVLLVQIKSPYFKVTWNSYSVQLCNQLQNTDKFIYFICF